MTVDREPSINLVPTVLRITGLDDYLLPQSGGLGAGGVVQCGNPPNPANPTAAPLSISGSGPATSLLWAPDLRNAYLGGTACQSLTGAGQVIGLLELDVTLPGDLQLYDSANPPYPAGIPALNFQTQVTFGLGGFPTPGPFGTPSPSSQEATADINIARAVAPGAKIVVFQGGPDNTLGFPNNHASGILKVMSNNLTLTTVGNSWNIERDDNERQDIGIMAGHGVSFFQDSGDFGNIGDPGDVRDLDNLTLTGGTFLSTNAVGSVPYYNREFTWNGGCPGKDVTGGGIMNGSKITLNSGTSSCGFPGCNTSPGLPPYQHDVAASAVPISAGGNGAANASRNYPDVSAVAANIANFLNGTRQTFGGTSAAAPFWAAFMALEREQVVKTGTGLRGFVNPTLYAIGSTRNLSGANDVYDFSFNDIADGVTNMPPPNTSSGFPSVAGYDLATGWGSPTCGLIQQLSTFNPTVPATYDHLFVHVVSGHQGLNDGDGASIDLYTDATTLQHSYRLKQKGEQGWHDFGQVHDSQWELQDANGNPVRLTGDGIHHFVLNLDQGGGLGNTGDNWDVTGLGAFLFNVGTTTNPGASPWACQLDLSGGQGSHVCGIPNGAGGNGCPPGETALDCGDGWPAICRMSSSADCSGVGGSQAFPAGKSAAPEVGGCPSGGQPTGSAEPFQSLQITFDTQDSSFLGAGTGGLRSDSELDVDIVDSAGNSILGQPVVIKPGGSQDNFAINEDTEETYDHSGLASAIVNLQGGKGLFLADFDKIKISLVSHDVSFPGEQGDTWGVNSVYVWGLGKAANSNAARPYTCLYAASGGEPQFEVSDSNPLLLQKQTGCIF